MLKINEISASLNNEVSHYRTVAKNISGLKSLLTGALRVRVLFQRHLQVRVLAWLCLLAVFLQQSRLAASV